MNVTRQPLSCDDLSREDRLLLGCTRVSLDDRTRGEIEDLAKAEIDWRVVFERSKFEGISSLLYVHIQEIPSVVSRVPAEILSRLRAIYHVTWARNSVLTGQWSETMTLFEQAGVQSITHKGMALIHSVYSDSGLRPMADIDLLIRAADLPLVRQTLHKAGFRTPDEGVEAEEAFRCYLDFARDSTVIDLHWDLAHYSRFIGVIRVDHEGLWKRARPLAVGRARGLMLCREDALLHLALHLTLGSEFGRLIWFTDIDAILRRSAGDLDWERLLEEASRWGIRGILAYTLTVAHESLGSPLPREVLPRLLPGRLRRVALNSAMQTTRPPSLGGQMNDIRSYVAETLLMDRLRDVFRVIWTSLFPSRTWVKLHYAVTSKWQIGLYRLLHPIRVCYLAAKHLH